MRRPEHPLDLPNCAAPTCASPQHDLVGAGPKSWRRCQVRFLTIPAQSQSDWTCLLGCLLKQGRIRKNVAEVPVCDAVNGVADLSVEQDSRSLNRLRERRARLAARGAAAAQLHRIAGWRAGACHPTSRNVRGLSHA